MAGSIDKILIRLLTPSDENTFFAHCERAVEAGGKNGAPPYTPLGRETKFSIEDRKNTISAWQLPTNGTNWKRTWGAFFEDDIIGCLILSGSKVKTKLHRAHLAMGIDNHNFFGKGLGTQFMNTAIEWAKDTRDLEWIDLNVFETNPRAISLYKKFNFKEYGRLKDHIRIEGKSYDHIMMTLKLR